MYYVSGGLDGSKLNRQRTCRVFSFFLFFCIQRDTQPSDDAAEWRESTVDVFACFYLFAVMNEEERRRANARVCFSAEKLQGKTKQGSCNSSREPATVYPSGCAAVASEAPCREALKYEHRERRGEVRLLVGHIAAPNKNLPPTLAKELGRTPAHGPTAVTPVQMAGERDEFAREYTLLSRA